MSGTPIEAGTVLARRFVLEDLLDESEGARFYRAVDRVLARDVAVHVVAEDDPRSSGLLSAARTSATVSDVHLLRVLDAATEDGVTYVVNEWGSGISVDRLLAEGPLSPRRAAWVAKEAAEAITAAHRHGIAHGRLIPENVVITDSGSVKLIGFVVDAVLRGRGCLPVAGGPPLDEHEADVLNLGALLYAGLVARWPGTAGTSLPPAPVEGGRTLRPRQVRAGVPRPLDAICELVLNRDQNPAVPSIVTAHEVYAALSDYIGDPAAVPMGLGGSEAGTLGGTTVRVRPAADPEATQAGTPNFVAPPADPGSTQAGVPSFDPQTDARAGSSEDWSGGWSEDPPPPPPPPPPFPEPDERPLFAPESAMSRRGRPSSQGGWVDGAPPPTWGPDADEPPPHDDDYDTGTLRADEPGRSWLRLALALALVLAVVIAVVLGLQLSRSQDQPTGPAAPSGGSSQASDNNSGGARASAVTIASVSDFDPDADPPEENPDLAPLAIDGDPATAWRTVTYFDPLGDLKSGVGLLVDLGRPTRVADVSLTLIGQPTSVELLAAAPDAAAPSDRGGLTRVAAAEKAGTAVDLVPGDATTTRYLVVWLTDLPAVDGGFRGQVAEIVVRS